ncbi:Fc.00g096580.m01.CDS01 [Cosmosporella sp. VM-42]
MADRTVKLDKSLLKQVFTGGLPESIRVFLNNRDKCVFKAEFPKGLDVPYLTCVVRLEAVNREESPGPGTFAAVAAMQQIAASTIPELIPQILQVGKATNLQGRLFDFSVIELVEGDTLEDVWEQMNNEEQDSVVVELVEALEKLHSVRFDDPVVQNILDKMLHEQSDKKFKIQGVFGGPHTGFLENGTDLLESIMKIRKLRKPFCTKEPVVGRQEMTIHSNFEELGSLFIDISSIEQWSREAVFCHNDLNPRNLILREYPSLDGKRKYKLTGIIDWELAGFYPASYELSLQDTYLGLATQKLSYYLLLKDSLKNIVPRSSSQVALLRANELICESQERLLSNGTNIPAHIRKRFLENTGLVRDSDPYAGWTRRAKDGLFHEYSSTEAQKLEDEVIEEMLTRRKLKAA